jgi:hypothetical protein
VESVAMVPSSARKLQMKKILILRLTVKKVTVVLVGVPTLVINTGAVAD